MIQYLWRRYKSFVYAFRGIGILVKTQDHAKIHLIASILIIAWGLYLSLSPVEWCLIVLCIALVLTMEAVNTAIEFLTDLVSPDYHPLAGKAKDVAAGAVLISAILATVIWAIIFIPKILSLK